MATFLINSALYMVLKSLFPAMCTAQYTKISLMQIQCTCEAGGRDFNFLSHHIECPRSRPDVMGECVAVLHFTKPSSPASMPALAH